MSNARTLLSELSAYKQGNDPHGQMDQIVIDRCKQLSTKENLVAEDVESLRKDCIYQSLCADFVITVLNIAIEDLVANEHCKS